MVDDKGKFIEFLLEKGVLRFEDSRLKSGRVSPYFLNTGNLSDGESIRKIGEMFANNIASLKDLDVLFGPAYKGIPLVVATSRALLDKGTNVGVAFNRKEAKEHGEATGGDLQKKVMIGSVEDGNNVVILEDVFTTGETKHEAVELLNKVANGVRINGVYIIVDRQEVGIDGKSVVDQFVEQKGIPVSSIISASDILNHVENTFVRDRLKIDKSFIDKFRNYLRVYGVREARSNVGGASDQNIIFEDRSIIPACDVSLEDSEEIFHATGNLDGIGGYKIPATAGRKGWEKWVETARKYTDKPLVYDHQKAGTDIPDTGGRFMRDLKESGFDAVILFPQAGPETERAWIYHAFNNHLGVIVGGRMTHPAYSESEGGFISDEGALEMYRIAARAGVTNFVVPGNKPDLIKRIREVIEEEEPAIDSDFYAPGFIVQGGRISEAAKAAGDRFHGIVGGGIYNAKDKRAAAMELTSQLQ